jgi:hypothetical protein
MGLGPSFAVFETLRRDDPGFTLQVDFRPCGTDHFPRPQPRQQRDFKGSRGGALSLVIAGKNSGACW